ncbi:endo alpha-1,4 polygalactosaminidase [Umezawaea beigongshangensis]|uniref:endo alpha-1,4 polygalactosaminidase n=1 Tax=Umezawaea beigongshangensis TaxID=2780383 RepID=UPI0018F1939F|nr:endo alpha-1,4 polygalactosaminidase [Umezawaea beigongshangensis]
MTPQFFTARRTATALVLTAATALVVGTTYGQASADAPANLPANVQADYQLGGAYAPPSGTGVVVRDRTAEPADELYNVCYVNGFQTQPGDEIDWWKSEHDDLLLRDDDGEYVGDVEWDELVLDVTTPEKRAELAGIVGGWIEGCAADGFQAVEIDNFDTFHRFPEFVEQSDALEYAELLVTTAHDAGLAIGQKNAAEIVAEGRAIGFDFAVAEECGEWNECDDYVGEYGSAVLVVEYQRQYFDATCDEFGDELSVVLRDVPLTTPGDEDDDEGEYVYDAC